MWAYRGNLTYSSLVPIHIMVREELLTVTLVNPVETEAHPYNI
jgi:hypothetical protein